MDSLSVLCLKLHPRLFLPLPKRKLCQIIMKIILIKENVNEGKAVVDVPQPSLESRATKNVDVSEVVLESMSVREPISQGSGPLAEEEVQQNLPGSDPGKKKKKKVCVPANGKVVQMAPQTG